MKNIMLQKGSLQIKCW